MKEEAGFDRPMSYLPVQNEELQLQILIFSVRM